MHFTHRTHICARKCPSVVTRVAPSVVGRYLTDLIERRSANLAEFCFVVKVAMGHSSFEADAQASTLLM